MSKLLINRKVVTFITFFLILFSISTIGIISVPFISKSILNIYITLQEDLNARQAESIARFIMLRSEAGVPEEEIKEEVQALILNTDSDRGYSCVVDQYGAFFINHPMTPLIGESVSVKNAIFISDTTNTVGNKRVSEEQIPEGVSWESTYPPGKNIRGVLVHKDETGVINPQMSEVVASFTIPGLQWTVSTHENMSRIFGEIKSLETSIIVIAIGLGLIIAFSTSFFARLVSSKYEEVIEGKNVIISEEKEKSDKLLLNILPVDIANELKQFNTTRPRHFKNVTVLFTDMVGFTKFSASVSPEKLVKELNLVFSYFDVIATKYEAEKIKTIGDAYMVATGVPNETENHVSNMVRVAFGFQSIVKKLKEEGKIQLDIRIGMHSGPLVAGVIGKSKFAYDLWGDTVNTASRMESTGEAGKIQISAASYALLKAQKRKDITMELRGTVEVKGKGKMKTYFLEKTPGIKKG